MDGSLADAEELSALVEPGAGGRREHPRRVEEAGRQRNPVRRHLLDLAGFPVLAFVQVVGGEGQPRIGCPVDIGPPLALLPVVPLVGRWIRQGRCWISARPGPSGNTPPPRTGCPMIFWSAPAPYVHASVPAEIVVELVEARHLGRLDRLAGERQRAPQHPEDRAPDGGARAGDPRHPEFRVELVAVLDTETSAESRKKSALPPTVQVALSGYRTWRYR